MVEKPVKPHLRIQLVEVEVVELLLRIQQAEAVVVELRPGVTRQEEEAVAPHHDLEYLEAVAELRPEVTRQEEQEAVAQYRDLE